MVTTRGKTVVVTQMNMKNKSKHIDTTRHQNLKSKYEKQATKDLQNSQKTIYRMAIISPYLSILL